MDEIVKIRPKVSENLMNSKKTRNKSTLWQITDIPAIPLSGTTIFAVDLYRSLFALKITENDPQQTRFSAPVSSQ